MSLQLRIGGEAAADQFAPLGFVSHSIERGKENVALAHVVVFAQALERRFFVEKPDHAPRRIAALPFQIVQRRGEARRVFEHPPMLSDEKLRRTSRDLSREFVNRRQQIFFDPHVDSFKLGKTHSDILSPCISHRQGWRQPYFSSMTYVTARVERRLYTPLVIKTLSPPEEL